ncbi:MAG: cytochrome-c oxidase, cbb3-type subunit III [Alysiella sp.]|uniref:cytochrome-c oxidase, cbb3-type subunit III n=1 Tax=Alysiella sp. TaxID=1872483 RepID=UPI0026DB763F|nr:cytochrome-c oxidase, cbb3-type subunit III [Alysiella sp.]MDO4433415.1 cytochrome-c oxidase, cbb3-type subunit III [Alysiella sp.]
MESQFTSPFWHYYIIAIVVASFIFIIWLLFSQDIKAKKEAPQKNQEVHTTGHEWDGIQEYSNPLPRWWFWMFVATILFSIGYLVAYPGLGDYKGTFGWTSANQYETDVKKANEETAQLYAKFTGMKVEDVAKDTQAMTIGKNLFDTYCIQCHGSDAKGSRGFPNLTDTDWLYGGTPEKIHETIAKGRVGIMVPWGPVLGEDSVRDATHFVMSLSGKEHNEDRALRGKAVFAANCAACHGAEGKGTMGMAPNLTDDTWLWGGSEKAIMETITGGRHNQMPAWEGFLNEDKIHLLTAYVWGISHPDNKALPTDNTAATSEK